jgi:hypothetical protein
MRPITRTQDFDDCTAKVTFPVSRKWVDSFMRQYLVGFVKTRSAPQEEPRLKVLWIFTDQKTRWMREAMHNSSNNQLLNLDELRIPEWEDCRSKKVLLPATSAGETFNHGISRNSKSITIMTYIFAGLAFSAPYLPPFYHIPFR